MVKEVLELQGIELIKNFVKNIKKERKIINHENIFNFFVITISFTGMKTNSSDFPTLASQSLYLPV